VSKCLHVSYQKSNLCGKHFISCLLLQAEALKKKFTEVSHVAETEKVAIIADALSNMEKSIQSIQTSINRFESGLKEDLRTIIREELGVVIKNEIEKETKNLQIIYKKN
jgi:hypothetical protein